MKREHGRGAARLAIALAMVLTSGSAAAGAAPDSLRAGPGPAGTTIRYLAGGSVYVDAGRGNGLLEGDTLLVMRESRAIGWLRVAFLSTRRAACDTLRTLEPLRVGDLVAYTARPAPPREPAATAAIDSTARPSTSASAFPARAEPASRAPALSRIHGRIGAGYLALSTRGGGGRLRQPSFDVSLEGRQLAGAPLDLSFDLRGRRTTWSSAFRGEETRDFSRVYRMSIAAHDPTGRYVVTIGRQSSPALSPVSLFDGALAETRGRRWSVGLFTGAQPDPLRLGLSGSIVEGGGYLEWRQPPESPRRWSVAAGAISSVESRATNRDFGFLQLSYVDPRVSLFGAQELDVNRGWKRDLGEPALSLTSSFLNANARLGRGLVLRGGYDNRRNVRLLRDRATPETEFDDRYREGAWGGLVLEPGAHLRLSEETRTSAIGGAQRLTSWSASAEAYRLGAWNGAVRSRVSHASGAGIATDLVSLGGGVDAPAGAHVEVTGGMRSTRDPLADVRDRALWESADLDFTLARRAYLDLSLERDHGGLTPGTQVYAGLSWRY